MKIISDKSMNLTLLNNYVLSWKKVPARQHDIRIWLEVLVMPNRGGYKYTERKGVETIPSTFMFNRHEPFH